jgi:hypothetical protein
MGTTYLNRISTSAMTILGFKKEHIEFRLKMDSHLTVLYRYSMEHRLPALRQSIGTYPLTSKLALWVHNAMSKLEPVVDCGSQRLIMLIIEGVDN